MINDLRDHDYEPGRARIEANVSPTTRSRNAGVRPFELNHLALFTKPVTVEDAMKDDDHKQWKSAMEEEIESHTSKNTWQLAELPPGKNVIKAKWVFKRKQDENGKIVRFKARLVAKGCAQKYGVDYNDTFSPVVRYTTIRFLMALAVQMNLKIYQMDAITAFLQGELEEEIYMKQPEGFEDGTDRVCLLKRAVYGLKQAGRQWNIKLDAALQRFGLKKSKLDPCIYLYW